MTGEETRRRWLAHAGTCPACLGTSWEPCPAGDRLRAAVRAALGPAGWLLSPADLRVIGLPEEPPF